MLKKNCTVIVVCPLKSIIEDQVYIRREFFGPQSRSIKPNYNGRSRALAVQIADWVG